MIAIAHPENLETTIRAIGRAAARRKTMTPEKAAEILRDFNNWRRGAGEYAWTGKPPAPENAKPRFTPSEIGRAIDLAIERLEATNGQ
mgnify:CR=1 FL=1